MNRKEKALVSFGGLVNALIQKKSLSRKQAFDGWRQVLQDEQPELHQGAFIAALAAKGETAPEIAGTLDAILAFDTNTVDMGNLDIVENCGTGMDALKTFNISTAAAIVAAAGGVRMAKHGARAITSRAGTVDIVERLGVDVECDVETVKRSIEKAGIGLFNGMSPRVHSTALFRILSQIRFGSTLNIAGSLAHPASPKRALRGVYSPEVLDKTVEVMRNIGFERAFVGFGHNGDKTSGIDELSTMGTTEIVELKRNGDLDRFAIEPEDFGLRRVSLEKIAAKESTHEAAVAVRDVINGSGEPAHEDIVCLNAAPLFVLAGKEESLRQGLELARRTIRSGDAQRKLSEWAECQQEPKQ